MSSIRKIRLNIIFKIKYKNNNQLISEELIQTILGLLVLLRLIDYVNISRAYHINK